MSSLKVLFLRPRSSFQGFRIQQRPAGKVIRFVEWLPVIKDKILPVTKLRQLTEKLPPKKSTVIHFVPRHIIL